MKIEYQHSIELPRTIVWKYIKKEEVLRNALPNCKSFEENPKGIYHAQIEVNLGLMKDVFTIEVQRKKEKSPAFYSLSVKGKGRLGEVNGTIDLFLKPLEAGTRIKLSGEAEVTGALAVAGQRTLAGGADKSLEQFFKTVEKEIRRSLYQSQRGR